MIEKFNVDNVLALIYHDSQTILTAVSGFQPKNLWIFFRDKRWVLISPLCFYILGADFEGRNFLLIFFYRFYKTPLTEELFNQCNKMY